MERLESAKLFAIGFGWRLFRVVALLLGISFLVFILLYLAPGRPELLLLGSSPATPALLQHIRAEYHLDDPVMVQYLLWLKGAIHLDFGQSIQTREPVWQEVSASFSITLLLGGLGFVLQFGVGILLGVWTAVAEGRWVDRVVVGAAIVGAGAPSYLSSIVLILVFAVALRIFPAFGPGPATPLRLWYFILPAIAVCTRGLALVIRITRAGMIEELGKDYVLFGWARGLSWSRVVLRHALRNALVPLITVGGLMIGDLVASAVLVETTFSLPGTGALLVQSVDYKDVPVVQGVSMVIAITVAVGAVIADVLYLIADPRLRLRAAA